MCYIIDMNLIRRFNGKNYTRYMAHRHGYSKHDAQKVASDLRKQNYKARIVNTADGWLVYYR